MILEGVSFKDTYEIFCFIQFFKKSRETMKKTIALYYEAKNQLQRLRLKGLPDPKKFVVPCTISEVEFFDALYDIGYKVSVVPKNIAEKLRLVIEAPMFKLTPADVSSKSPLGIVNNLEVKVWNSMVFIDFMCWRWNIYAYSFWKKVSSYSGCSS